MGQLTRKDLRVCVERKDWPKLARLLRRPSASDLKVIIDDATLTAIIDELDTATKELQEKIDRKFHGDRY